MSQKINPVALNRPNRGVFAEFLASASRLQGLMLGLIGILVSVVVWFTLPSTTIRIAWLWIVIIVGSVIVWLLVDVARRLNERPVRYLPLVVTSLSSNGLTERPILILEPSELFGHGSLVTVFYRNDSTIELQVGSGHVLNIQTDRQIQVEITHWAKAHLPVLDQVRSGSRDALNRLLIKPSVTEASLAGGGFEAVDAVHVPEQEEGIEENG